MTPQLEQAIAKLKEKGEALGYARAEEQRLEDERALVKGMAIIRLMKKHGIAATPAEKIVEEDLEYMAHRVAQRESVVLRFVADAQYWAAKAEATQLSLITPDVFALSEELNEYADSLKLLREDNAQLQTEIAVRARESGELVEANRSLLLSRNEAGQLAANRLFQIESLQDANRKLQAQLHAQATAA